MRPLAYRSYLDELSTLFVAGIPLLEALATLARSPHRAVAAAAEGIAERIRKGSTLSEAMASEPARFPRAHIAILAAAEKAGAVPAALMRLRDEVDRRIAAFRALRARAAYPVLVLVAAALLGPLYLLFEGRLGTYLGLEALLLGGAVACAVLAQRAAERLGPSLARAPFLGRIVYRSAVGETLSLLGLLLQAGIGVREALELAADAARHPDLARDLRDAGRSLQGGANLSEALGRVPGIPPLERGRIASGERAGAMDRALQEAGRSLEESFRRAADRVLLVLPIVIYIVAGAVVAVLYLNAILKSFPALDGL